MSKSIKNRSGERGPYKGREAVNETRPTITIPLALDAPPRVS